MLRTAVMLCSAYRAQGSICLCQSIRHDPLYAVASVARLLLDSNTTGPHPTIQANDVFFHLHLHDIFWCVTSAVYIHTYIHRIMYLSDM